MQFLWHEMRSRPKEQLLQNSMFSLLLLDFLCAEINIDDPFFFLNNNIASNSK